MDALRERIEQRLADSLPRDGEPRLVEAMRYALTGGGKRLRPLLVYHAGQLAGAPLERLDHAAVAVEMIHAYSLVHDDLPAMDDDELRRGHPTCHIAFDEATAILAGDALQTLAFQHLAAMPHPSPARLLQMIRTLGTAAGAAGMAGGQAMDLALTGQDCDLNTLERLHRLKTGALIEAALQLGLLSAESPPDTVGAALDTVGQNLGLAFQIQDDVLDVTSDTHTLGKAQGADAARNQPTFASLMGIDAATKRYQSQYDEALEQLAEFGKSADGLRKLILQIRDRKN